MQILRSVIQHVRIMRRGGHRRYALHAVNQIAGGIAVQRLRADPIALLLPGREVHHAVLAFARAIDDFRIFGMRHDWPGFTTWTSSPVFASGGVGLTRHDDRRVVLLSAIEFV